MKEDTALMLGLSAFLLALSLWRDRPTRGRLIWLGMACGLAASGKYLGALCFIPAAALVLSSPAQAPEMSRRRRLAPLLVPGGLVFLAINYPLLGQFRHFLKGLFKGAKLVTQGRSPADLPNVLVFEGLAQLSWPVLLLAAVGVTTLVAMFRRRCKAGWSLLWMGLLFTGMLMLTPLSVPDRYLLVPAVSIHALAGLGIVLIVESACRNRGRGIQRTARLAGAVAALGLVWVAGPAYRGMAVEAFDRADARAELISWANETLSSDAELAVSKRVRMPGLDGFEPADPAIRFERNVRSLDDDIRIDPEAVDEMRRDGVTHLVVRSGDYRRYLERSNSALATMDPMQDLPRHEKPKLVWHTPKLFESKNRWLGLNLVVLQL